MTIPGFIAGTLPRFDDAQRRSCAGRGRSVLTIVIREFVTDALFLSMLFSTTVGIHAQMQSRRCAFRCLFGGWLS